MKTVKKLAYRFFYLPLILWYAARKALIGLKYKVFRFYYDRLCIHAYCLYRQSPLYRYRWEEAGLGLEFAEQVYKENKNEQLFFFHMAQKEPFAIRRRLFMDGLLGREFTHYYP